MSIKIQQARDAGYSDEEILDHLAQKNPKILKQKIWLFQSGNI